MKKFMPQITSRANDSAVGERSALLHDEASLKSTSTERRGHSLKFNKSKFKRFSNYMPSVGRRSIPDDIELQGGAPSTG